MSRHKRASAYTVRLSIWVVIAAVGLPLARDARGQVIQQSVGGVSVDAQGVVTNVELDELNQLKQHRAKAMQNVPGDLQAAALRKVSLRQLETAIAEHRQNGTPLDDEMRYLAGMQRIKYVFVYPELQDIVLAGPGEGWKLSAMGEVVGVTTNRPVLLLDDLLVALRSIDNAKQSGISCSIDPSSDGIARLQSLFKRTRAVGNDPNPILAAIEHTLGPQTITVTGVPDTSHFARVLVAADYRMKRLAMAFEESPVDGLPSFMEMIRTSAKAARPMLPRWWLAPNYDALLADPDGLAWELRGAGVKAMTEDEFIDAAGQRQGTGKANPLAKKWADKMTAHYDELSAKDSIFGQLRNCMDLAVVAALISKENLTEKCGWSMPLLMNPELLVESYNAPHSVDSQASVVRKGTNWIVSASGGIQINPWAPVEKATPGPALGALRRKAATRGNKWWWN